MSLVARNKVDELAVGGSLPAAMLKLEGEQVVPARTGLNYGPGNVATGWMKAPRRNRLGRELLSAT